nr:Nidogen and EGF calcium-binding domain containing protein [Haemonchus contortus]
MHQPLLVGLCALIGLIHGTLLQFPFREHRRYKRQLGSGEVDVPNQQIDLNITVPYIFSARLYPYGETKGDLLIHGTSEVYKLANPFHYLGQIYDTIYIHSSGYVSFSPTELQPSALPVSEPVLATYWMPTEGATVYYRETDDLSIVNLAHNEVNIQYRYGSKFRVKSVLIITWEGGRPENSDSEGNLFQLALIIGDSMTFAHFVYSKLNSNDNAVAGFSSMNSSYSLPDSATHDAMLLSDKSDIGIPGEWLFRVDGVQVHLCGAGFKGLECIDSCAASQWFNDCSRSCHCDGGDPCDQETGRCPNGRCSPGWKGAPICDEDEDECEKGDICPSAQPDCMNTPGSYLCICFEYDEQNKRCKGSKPPGSSEEKIPVEVVPLQPSFARVTPSTKASVVRNRFQSTTPFTMPSTTTTQMITTRTTTTSTTTTTETPPLIAKVTEFKPVKIKPVGQNCPPCDIHATCRDGQCVCQPGWKSYQNICVDVNECAEGAVCGSHSECVNRPGSYDCVCEKGYRFENDECVDINECRETSPCGDNLGVECVNRPGSYECRCMDGFDGDPRRGCSDVNECALGTQHCGPHAKCINTVGAYECECLPGFERITEGAGCTDIDECFLSVCHPAASCANLVGSFSCSCPEGFVGDGMQCHETILYPIANDSIVIPRKADAMATINLPSPVFVFGKPYSKVYLSSNGVLSFDRPLPGLIERAESLHEAAVFALHVQYDYAREGLVAYTYINESDMSAYSLLSRSSIGVQNNFRLTNFRTKTLHLFTFDRMRQAGSENLNSFQIVLAQSDEATMLTLIYEKTQSKGPMTGIASPKSPFFLLPNDMLSTHSNVGQPGKWMYRIDDGITTCPAGAEHPPMCDKDCPPGRYGFSCQSSCHCALGFPCDPATGVCANGCAPGWTGLNCDQDVDECATGMIQCAPNAECVNSVGGYQCTCRKGYSGDGKQCTLVERCYARYGRSCSTSGSCEEFPDGPRCVCARGYRGDGFICTAQTPIHSSVEDITSLMKNEQSHDNIDIDVGDHPFVMTDWQTSARTSPRPITTTRRRPGLQSSSTSRPLEKTTSHGAQEDMAEATTLLFLIGPAVLCAIWVILVIVVIAVCCRNKHSQRTRSGKQGVWNPPTCRTVTVPSNAAQQYPSRIRPFESY